MSELDALETLAAASNVALVVLATGLAFLLGVLMSSLGQSIVAALFPACNNSSSAAAATSTSSSSSSLSSLFSPYSTFASSSKNCESRLGLAEGCTSKAPKHVAVIMDGNRRYGKECQGDPLQGHWKGMQTFIDFIQWSQELGIESLTAYAFSTENWSRDEKEVQLLMSLFIKYAESFKEEARKRKIKFNIVSTDFSRLPAKVQTAVLELQQATETNEEFTVNFCLSYGGRGEIVNATRKICQRVQAEEMTVEDINEESFAAALSTTGPCPDILIRTSGEYRLSNFLLWQLAYTELFFVNKYWPQLTKDDLVDVLSQFSHRKRRFGV